MSRPSGSPPLASTIAGCLLKVAGAIAWEAALSAMRRRPIIHPKSLRPQRGRHTPLVNCTVSQVYTIRESLQGRLQTFIRESGFHSVFLEDLIRDLVVLLSSYREEDVPLFPPIYVGNTRDDLAPVFTIGQPIAIGSVNQTSDAASTLLKDLAPLAKEGWAAYVFCGDNATFVYGVFRSMRHSLSTAADEVIADLGPSVKLIFLKNCGHQAVELHNTSREKLTAVFRISATPHIGLEPQIKLFADVATASLVDAFEFNAYLKRILSNVIQHSHGTLLAVIPPLEGSVPESISNSVRLSPQIDLAGLHREAFRLRDADSLADLRAAEVLLAGMIGSDGIVVFGCDGTLKAYRSFIRPEPNEAVLLPSEGGARRRTFELMKIRIPTHYTAAFYRSRDGETRCEVMP
jgi:hypothetical protein